MITTKRIAVLLIIIASIILISSLPTEKNTRTFISADSNISFTYPTIYNKLETRSTVNIYKDILIRKNNDNIGIELTYTPQEKEINLDDYYDFVKRGDEGNPESHISSERSMQVNTIPMKQYTVTASGTKGKVTVFLTKDKKGTFTLVLFMPDNEKLLHDTLKYEKEYDELLTTVTLQSTK